MVKIDSRQSETSIGVVRSNSQKDLILNDPPVVIIRASTTERKNSPNRFSVIITASTNG